MDPVWTRLSAEVEFARGNMSSALAKYLETAAANTDFFSKPAFQVKKILIFVFRQIVACEYISLPG